MVPLPEVCERLNGLLLRDAESDQYLTMSIAHLNLVTGEVEFCQSGHPSPVIQRQDGRIESLELWSTPVGLIENCAFATVAFRLEAGDRLVIHSDGITECPDPDGNLLEKDGLQENLTGLAGLRCDALLEGLSDRLRAFHGTEDFPDDVSAVVVQAG